MGVNQEQSIGSPIGLLWIRMLLNGVFVLKPSNITNYILQVSPTSSRITLRNG